MSKELLTIYHFIKGKSGKEEETKIFSDTPEANCDLRSYSPDDLVSIIKQSFLDLSNEAFEYEKQLIKLEADVRKHLKSQFQMKLYIDNIEGNTLTKDLELKKANNMISGLIENSKILEKENEELRKSIKEYENEIYYLKDSLSSIKTSPIKIKNNSNINGPPMLRNQSKIEKSPQKENVIGLNNLASTSGNFYQSIKSNIKKVQNNIKDKKYQNFTQSQHINNPTAISSTIEPLNENNENHELKRKNTGYFENIQAANNKLLKNSVLSDAFKSNSCGPVKDDFNIVKNKNEDNYLPYSKNFLNRSNSKFKINSNNLSTVVKSNSKTNSLDYNKNETFGKVKNEIMSVLSSSAMDLLMINKKKSTKKSNLIPLNNNK